MKMSRFSNYSSSGFTLVELLVVVTVFAGLGVLLVSSLLSILKSNTKAELIKEVRQSGSFALEVMTKKITGGTSPQCAEDNSWVSVVDTNNERITFLCSDGYLASQSAGTVTPLTNQNETWLSSCLFDCQTVGTGDQVTIEFTLSQVGESALRQEDVAQQSFSKVILVRN